MLRSQVASLPGEPRGILPLPTRPVGGSPFRSEVRQEIRDKRSADPSVQTAYGYGQGGSYVLSSSVACLPGDPCNLPAFPARPVGGAPFRSEFRHHAKANKRSADPSVQTAYGYGQGGSYVLSSSVACLPGDPCNLPAFPTRPVGGAPFRSEFRHHAKAN